MSATPDRRRKQFQLRSSSSRDAFAAAQQHHIKFAHIITITDLLASSFHYRAHRLNVTAFWQMQKSRLPLPNTYRPKIFVQIRTQLLKCARILHTKAKKKTATMKKALRETHTLRAGCIKAEPKIFAPPQPPSWGRGTAKVNQLETVTTFTYKSSLVKIDARNFELSW